MRMMHSLHRDHSASSIEISALRAGMTGMTHTVSVHTVLTHSESAHDTSLPNERVVLVSRKIGR